MIYLDNASTVMKRPIYVKQNMIKALEEFSNPNRGFYKSSYESGLAIFETRNTIARFFNCKPSHVIFTSNATVALNYAIQNCCKKGSHVITTNIEHNSVLRPLKSTKCDVTFLDVFCNNDEILNRLAESIRPETKVLVCNHASNVIGKPLPIKQMSNICKKHGITVILDVAQSAGILDCDIQELGVDILCFTGHKSLYGPTGIGGIVLSEKYLENNEFKCLVFGGNGIDTFNKNDDFIFPDSYDAGTQNIVGIYGLQGGIKYIEEQGLENLYNKSYALAKKFYDAVIEIPYVKVYEKFERGHTPTISLNIGDVSSIDVADMLYKKYDIATRHGFHCAPFVHEHFNTKGQGMVRFSFSSFNNENDVDVAITGIKYISSRIKNNI